MRKYTAWCLGLLLAVGPLTAAEPQGKLVYEAWDAAYLEGAKVGASHTTVREVERDGQKLLRAGVELNLALKRYNATAHLRMQTGSDETPDGKVLAVVMKQFLSQDQQLTLTGVVEGDQLHVRTQDGRLDKKVPWDDRVIGLYRAERVFQDHKVEPGDHFTYLSYEPTVTSVVTVRVTVKEPEEVEVLGVKKRLLRVEAVPDKVRGPQGPIPLPSMTVWLDKDRMAVRNQTELPGVGTLVFYRTTRAVAQAEGAPATVGRGSDIGLKSMVRLNRIIERPQETRSVVYRVTLQGDDDPASAFAQDDRQTARDVHGKTFDLHVRALRRPRPVEEAAPAKEEFLKSCTYLDSDDARVRNYARQAVGPERDPWKKAQRIERWVYLHVRHDNTVPFTTAGKVAEDLRGDCRQKAMLAAAMCRAAGVPSRTAVGLIYAEVPEGSPVMAFHMWAEVYVAGQWLAIDGTLGQGSVGADHVKIADSSWYNTESQTPLLPVARVLGKVAIRVVRVNDEE